jgi:hypothetical protein
MPSFVADISLACTRWGSVGVLLHSLAETLALTAWVGVFTVARYSRDTYLFFALVHWAFVLVLWYALVGLFESPQPNAHCTGGAPVGIPARSIFIVYDYLMVAALHDLYWGNWRQVGWLRWLTMLAIAVLVPLAYSLTGNYTPAQCVYAVLLGCAAGALFSLLMFGLWVHYLPALDSHPLFRGLLGWKHDPAFQRTWPL